MRKGRIHAFTAVVEEAHNFVPSKSEEKNESPSLLTILGRAKSADSNVLNRALQSSHFLLRRI